MFNTQARVENLEDKVSSLESSAKYIRQDYNRLRDDFRNMVTNYNVLREQLDLIKAYFNIEVIYEPAKAIVRERSDE